MKQKNIKPITLRFLRIEKETGKRPKEIAEILEVDLSTFYKTKRGDIPPSSNILTKIEYKLGYNREWVEFGKGDPKKEEAEVLAEVENQLKLINKINVYELYPILNALPDLPKEEDKKLLLDFLNLYVQKFQ
ncbi:hypothetical protein LEP1GSC132_2519 [Leptospira kirschneri str. 200803703]|uniref:hypothetical protein n=1 Tax=Leptospira kirschneri TaxID=29507 RepID=UPI0002BF65D0|nr:hypothetical protein [Leptospira kirschneri]EMO66402.1 hypothetical protein LEP1GSC132_2519 [Leptospira kirschneri str. 200803703]